MPRIIIVSLLLSVIAACASTPPPQAPSRPELNGAPKGKTYTDWGEFVLDAGDVVNILVEEQPTMNGIQKISPSGSIVLPVIGMIRARGLTETQLRESIYLKVKPHVKIPRVSLNVVQMNSYVVFFEGKVGKPGSFKLESRTSMQQGIVMAGGLKSDDVSRITMVRMLPDGSRKRFESSVKGLKEGFMDNFLLERGDVIIVD
ncbi:MAG: hypothetical protein EOP10_19405 [Proteobacteria bacterium]|nr:MAG: hypothetical protein EOP10_19405 [Pseudomonadota bacterium]